MSETSRTLQLEQLREASAASEAHPIDLLVIGGGAMGLGTAAEAARRGYRTVLLEQKDFAHGTSSRSTKLIHGGIRYLEQRDFGLVREALHERRDLCQCYPEIVRPLTFIIPTWSRREHLYYRSGTWLYDRLAGRANLSPSRSLTRQDVLTRLAYLRGRDLRGGIEYTDAQFDDARLAIRLALDTIALAGIVLNYIRVTNLLSDRSGRIHGVEAMDELTGEAFTLNARVVVNAAGVAADRVRRMAQPPCESRLRFSRGTHIVLDLPDASLNTAMLIPRTPDKRVVFMIPWHGKLLVGTTDVECDAPEFEPLPTPGEIDFLLELSARYLPYAPHRNDIRSAWAGQRALVLQRGRTVKSSQLSRTHSIEEEPHGLYNVWGGKWTTFAAVAREILDRAQRTGSLPAPPTRPARVVTAHATTREVDDNEHQRIHPHLPYCEQELEQSIQYEMAVHVEDVLARRTRSLFLDASAAASLATQVAARLAEYHDRDAAWQAEQIRDFHYLAKSYQPQTRDSHE